MGSAGQEIIGDQYHVKIEEHGMEPWGDQHTVLFDYTGFTSRVYDVGFTADCKTAVLFVHNHDGSDSAPDSDRDKAFIKLNLDGPTDIT